MLLQLDAEMCNLIQKNADVKAPVYEEYPNRIAKMWKDEEKKAK